MDVMIVLLLGSLLVGCSGRVSPRWHTRLAIVAATAATVIYYGFTRAM